MPSLPRQILIEPRVEHHALTDPAGTLHQRLDASLRGEDWAGRRVVVGVGSRGIDRVAEMARTLVMWLRQQGAEPIVMPAMGSHGGGTPEGQRELLASYGVTEHAIDAPIDASMGVVEVGQLVEGVAVVVSTRALNADAVVLLNRIKPHTDFGSAVVGSGLVKMSAIGLGKAEGAFRCHWAAATRGHEACCARCPEWCSAICPGSMAWGSSRTDRIALRSSSRCAAPSSTSANPRCWPRRVPGCRCCRFRKSTCWSSMRSARTSAARGWTPTSSDAASICSRCPTGARPSARSVRALTPASHGNAIGIGMADIVSDRLVEAMDRHKTYTNAVSAMTPGTARVSIHFPTDRECLRAALRVSAANPVAPRIIESGTRLPSTGSSSPKVRRGDCRPQRPHGTGVSD